MHAHTERVKRHIMYTFISCILIFILLICLIRCSSRCTKACCSCNVIKRTESYAAMQESLHSINRNYETFEPYETGFVTTPARGSSGYAQSSSLGGYMYVNEHGQMCGPYIQQQLYEGLSTGFLPEDLPVYPVVDGKLTNAVPLKYLQQIPNQGYIVPSILSSMASESSKIATHWPIHSETESPAQSSNLVPKQQLMSYQVAADVAQVQTADTRKTDGNQPVLTEVCCSFSSKTCASVVFSALFNYSNSPSHKSLWSENCMICFC